MDFSAGVLKGVKLSDFVTTRQDEYDDVSFDSRTGDKKVRKLKKTVFIFEGEDYDEDGIMELIDEADLVCAPHWYDEMDVEHTVIGKYVKDDGGDEVAELLFEPDLDKKILKMLAEFTKAEIKAEDLKLYVILIAD